jgi:predicted nuclease of restriction endonuclease-like (RecB) superfamily
MPTRGNSLKFFRARRRISGGRFLNRLRKLFVVVRQLQRQIGSLLYDRTALSTDKQAVIEHARQQAAEAPALIADLIRDPYVLEFAGLAEKSHYREKDLEKALLDHLQAFLLELGAGFCFEARQKRVTVGVQPTGH